MPTNKSPQKRKKKKRVSITLSEREGDMLSQYARDRRCTRPAAVLRIVKTALRDYFKEHEQISKNQLSLFDVSDQMSLFDDKAEGSGR